VFLSICFGYDEAPFGRYRDIIRKEFLKGYGLTFRNRFDCETDIFRPERISLKADVPEVQDELFSNPDTVVISLEEDPVSPVARRDTERFFYELQVLLEAGEKKGQFPLAVKGYFNGARTCSLF